MVHPALLLLSEQHEKQYFCVYLYTKIFDKKSLGSLKKIRITTRAILFPKVHLSTTDKSFVIKKQHTSPLRPSLSLLSAPLPYIFSRVPNLLSTKNKYKIFSRILQQHPDTRVRKLSIAELSNLQFSPTQKPISL